MFLGIPSIALSFDGGDETTYEEFSWCSRYVRWWIHSADFETPSANVFYNVNFPHWSETPPTQLVTVPLGHREYKNRYIRRLDPQNHEYFWFEGRQLPATNTEDSDVEALKRGLITLTPIKMDVTDYELLKRLKPTLIVPNLNS